MLNKNYKPKVSIIIPVYNVENYLRECLDSIVNQPFKDIEIICIDDGSTDSSYEILEEYAKKEERFVLFKQENKGAGAARNKGIDIAKGEYLYFLDGDDYLLNDSLENLYLKIYQNNADICLAKQCLLKEEIIEDTKSLRIDLLPLKETFIASDIPKKNFQIASIGVYTKIYKKDFIKINNINFQNIKTTNDVYFNFIALILANKITYIDKPVIVYRVNVPNCLTSKRGKSLDNINIAYEGIQDILKHHEVFSLYEYSFYMRYFQSCKAELSNSEKTFNLSLLNNKNLSKIQKYYRIWNSDFKLKPYQYIFSVKNSKDRNYKIIYLLGIKFYYKWRGNENF